MMTRLNRERKVLQTMMVMYCKMNHGGGPAPCPECLELYHYAMKRLDSCHYIIASAGTSKPVCRNCTTHCYRPAMRDRIRIMMRQTGPRLLLRHPVMALRHLVDGFSKPAKQAR